MDTEAWLSTANWPNTFHLWRQESHASLQESSLSPRFTQKTGHFYFSPHSKRCLSTCCHFCAVKINSKITRELLRAPWKHFIFISIFQLLLLLTIFISVISFVTAHQNQMSVAYYSWDDCELQGIRTRWVTLRKQKGHRVTTFTCNAEQSTCKIRCVTVLEKYHLLLRALVQAKGNQTCLGTTAKWKSASCSRSQSVESLQSQGIYMGHTE